MKEFQFEIDGVLKGGQESRLVTGKATASALLASIQDAGRNFGDTVTIEKEQARLRDLPVGGIVITALDASAHWHFQVLIERVR